jgi:hypothetical protein
MSLRSCRPSLNADTNRTDGAKATSKYYMYPRGGTIDFYSDSQLLYLNINK